LMLRTSGGSLPGRTSKLVCNNYVYIDMCVGERKRLSA
jgi:hypothetical protein